MIRKPFQWSLILALGFASIPLVNFAQSGDESARYAEAGQQALAAERYVEAQTAFEKLAKLEPGVAEVHATLAVIDFKLRNYEQAVTEIRTAQKLKPGLPKLDSLLGMSLAESGRFSEALPGLEKGFKQSTDKEVRRMCGLQLLRTYTGLRRDSEAVETALALNKLYPDDPEVLYQTGRVYGNFTYQVMEKLHDEAPNSIWMLQAQGEAAESQKDYDTALAAFNHVLVLDANRPGIHYRMGRVYLTRFRENHLDKDRDAALEQFRAELAIDPQNGNAEYELAQSDYDLGNFQQAQWEFESVVSKHPDFEQARVGLAGILLENDKNDLAAQQLRRAVELNPNDDVAWYRLTRALRTSGSPEEQKKAMTEFHRVHALVIAHTAPAKASESDQEVTPQKLGEISQP
ncbi:tetratricopeptide repeat protein [Acidicapsa acidisoli]|uniref:tetratricopeptide repeat protein n=1 Tax=Acidicapsa acidisoli TaxID=1615681 RepID=UPI0021E029BB|nr:tetratricopeptide repeat protein [Acidicapsa acidisoli]